MTRNTSTLADPAMLSKIDKLFACNVGHQSSGKSSVLEGLTRLPFPRDSGLCTRFATLLATTMKTQSEKWDDLALGYISDIVYMTDCFLDKLLGMVCPDEGTLDRLKELLADDLLARYKKAFEQVRFILEVERNNMPGTLNHYFNDNLEKCRQKRTRNLAMNKSHNSNGLQIVRVDDVTTTMNMSNKDHAVQDLHDILRAYYKVARKRIVDNVINQGGRYWLIMGPNTPVKLFTPAFVSQLSVEQLQEIAGEEALTKRRRAQLLKEQEDLEKGRKILS